MLSRSIKSTRQQTTRDGLSRSLYLLKLTCTPSKNYGRDHEMGEIYEWILQFSNL